MLKELIKQNRKIFLLLGLLVVIVYANSLPNVFVSDDIAGIRDNPNIGRFGFWFNSANNWLNAATYHVFGINPLPFRAINILFHLGNVWLVFILLIILTRKKSIAILATAIFAVHPILIESVSWISGGPYAKYVFFLLLAFLLYINSNFSFKLSKKRQTLLICLSLLYFLIALSFSEKAIIFPAILFIYEISFGSLKKKWKPLLPYFALSAIWFATNFFRLGLRIQGLSRDFYSGDYDHHPLLQIPIAITKYFELIFWPDKLSLYQTEMFFTSLNFWLRTIITILFLALIIFCLIKKKRQLFFWLSFFIIGLLPTLTPLGIAWIVAERYIYFSALAIIAVFIILWEALNERVYETKKIYWAIGILIVAALGARTITRNMDWKNEDVLWIATAKVAPSGHIIHNNLGDVYGRAGNKTRAIKEFQTAIVINPYYAEAMHNLANTYTEIDQIDAAIYWYQQAIKYRPALWQSYQNLSAIYYNLGQPENAKKY